MQTITNIFYANVVYDSSGLLTGLNPIDLIDSNLLQNKTISRSVYNILAKPPEKVSSLIDSNTILLTKIEDSNGRYILVSDSYGKISDQMYSLCEACNFKPKICDCNDSTVTTTLSFKNESADTAIDVLSVKINDVTFPSINNVRSGETKSSQANVETNIVQNLALTVYTTLEVNTALAIEGSNSVSGLITQIPGGYTITFAGFNFGANSQIKIN